MYIDCRCTLPHVVGLPHFSHALNRSIPRSANVKTLATSGLRVLIRLPANKAQRARKLGILQNEHACRPSARHLMSRSHKLRAAPTCSWHASGGL